MARASAGRKLVIDRQVATDGNPCRLLDPVAQWLESPQPLAATLLLPALIEDTLEGAKSTRYRHAARHLAGRRSLVFIISDYDRCQPHAAFVARLCARHSRKSGFRELVDHSVRS